MNCRMRLADSSARLTLRLASSSPSSDLKSKNVFLDKFVEGTDVPIVKVRLVAAWCSCRLGTLLQGLGCRPPCFHNRTSLASPRLLPSLLPPFLAGRLWHLQGAGVHQAKGQDADWHALLPQSGDLPGQALLLQQWCVDHGGRVRMCHSFSAFFKSSPGHFLLRLRFLPRPRLNLPTPSQTCGPRASCSLKCWPCAFPLRPAVFTSSRRKSSRATRRAFPPNTR